MDCGDYQKDNRWLRNRIVMGTTEGVIFEGWIVVTIRKKYDVMTIRKIIKDYDGDDGRSCI